MLLLTSILLATFVTANADSILQEYEGRTITSIEITFEGSPSDPSAEVEFLSIIKLIPNTQFSAVAVRDSLQALFDSERVASARVEVVDVGLEELVADGRLPVPVAQPVVRERHRGEFAG